MRCDGISRQRRRLSKGSVLVETALIFIVFFVLLIGAFDFGQFLFKFQALLERARYAARWGSVSDPTNTAAIQNMVLYGQPATPPSGTGGYFGLTTSMVQVTTEDSGTDDYRVTVLISGYPFLVLSPFITGSYTGPAITISVPIGLTG